MLLTGATHSAVAEAIGVDRRTLFRWRRDDPRFAARLESRRRDLYSGAADRFRSMLDLALDQFEKQLRDPYTPTAFRAARALLTLAAIGRAFAPPRPNESAGTRVRGLP